MTPRQQGPVPVQARRARVVFEAAIKRRPSERIAYIDGACLGDEALRAQVMYLLDTSESDATYAPPPILPQITPERPIELEQPAARIVVAKVEEAAPPPAEPQSEEAPKQAQTPTPEFDDEKTRVAPPQAAPAAPPAQTPSPEFDDEKTRVAPPSASLVAPPLDGSSEPATVIAPPADDEKTIIAPAPPATTAAKTVTTATQTTAHAPLSPGEMPTTGSRIGPYQLLHCIGQGGMGSVYAASRADQEYKKIVAIKLVTSELNSAEMLRRFRNERQVLAGLDHPGIARLLDGGTTDRGIPYLVMEFVEGLPIDKYCESNHLSLRDRLKLFQKVCEAVQYAHQNLIIHRDIKPGNILISNTGDPKLLDFGIARLMTAESSVEELELSKGEAQPMTLRYASPEQVKGESISTSSDLYSLGVLLYELITGRHPFQNALTGRAEIEAAIIAQAPQKPSLIVLEKAEGKAADRMPPEGHLKLSRHLRGDLDAIALQVLRKEAKARYSSVQSLSEDISAYLTNLPISARNDSYGYRAGKFIHKHATSVIAACLLVLAMVTATFVSVRFARTAQLERTKAINGSNEVRKFANFVLFRFDDALSRDGVTPARKLMVSEALGYLNGLAGNARGDLALEKEVINGYLKVGDVQGNPYLPNLGDAAGAKQSYSKALAVAQAIRAKYPSDPDVQGLLATVDMKFGNLVFRSDPVAALKPYQEAQSLLEGLGSNDAATKRSLMHVLLNIGSIQIQLGDTKLALGIFSRTRQIATDLYNADHNDGDAREMMATAGAKSGDALAASGATSQALDQFRNALAIYEEIASQSPQSPVRRRILAVLISMGDTFAASGRKEEAVDSARKAVQINETLLKEDPKNEQYRQDLAGTLQRLAEALVTANHKPEAWQVTDRALKFLRPIVDAPNASFDITYQFCWILLTTPFKELQDPALAMHHAEKLAEITKGKDPDTLDLLARAYFGSGDATRAVETETKAISLLPANTQSESRKEFESNLAKFRAGTQAKKTN